MKQIFQTILLLLLISSNVFGWGRGGSGDGAIKCSTGECIQSAIDSTPAPRYLTITGDIAINKTVVIPNDGATTLDFSGSYVSFDSESGLNAISTIPSGSDVICQASEDPPDQSNSYLTHSGKSWVIDEHIGKRVIIMYDNTYIICTITDSGTDTVTVAENLYSEGIRDNDYFSIVPSNEDPVYVGTLTSDPTDSRSSVASDSASTWSADALNNYFVAINGSSDNLNTAYTYRITDSATNTFTVEQNLYDLGVRSGDIYVVYKGHEDITIIGGTFDGLVTDGDTGGTGTFVDPVLSFTQDLGAGPGAIDGCLEGIALEFVRTANLRIEGTTFKNCYGNAVALIQSYKADLVGLDIHNCGGFGAIEPTAGRFYTITDCKVINIEANSDCLNTCTGTSDLILSNSYLENYLAYSVSQTGYAGDDNNFTLDNNTLFSIRSGTISAFTGDLALSLINNRFICDINTVPPVVLWGCNSYGENLTVIGNYTRTGSNLDGMIFSAGSAVSIQDEYDSTVLKGNSVYSVSRNKAVPSLDPDCIKYLGRSDSSVYLDSPAKIIDGDPGLTASSNTVVTSSDIRLQYLGGYTPVVSSGAVWDLSSISSVSSGYQRAYLLAVAANSYTNTLTEVFFEGDTVTTSSGHVLPELLNQSFAPVGYVIVTGPYTSGDSLSGQTFIDLN